MIDQNIGNPEITRKHLSEMQTFYEAQLVAKHHYDALMTSLKPLQYAADVLRASGVVNVDALLSQPVSATKAMIDEMEAEADADELNDLTPHEGEEEGETVNSEALDELFEADGELYDADAQPVEQEAEPAPEAVDHAAEATAQLEAQAETESTETEAETVTFDLPEGAKMTGTGYSSSGGAFADYVVPETGATGRVYATDGGVGSFQLAVHSHSEPLVHTDEPLSEDDTAETMQAIAQAVEAVEVEPEAVTEQPSDTEPKTPSQPEEPKAERKTLDCTDDYTQEEVLAQNGNANFNPRENQPDDIAAKEREEFRAYNPWAPTAKAEG